MSCRHDLALGTCIVCYPTTGCELPKSFEPNLDGPGAVLATEEHLCPICGDPPHAHLGDCEEMMKNRERIAREQLSMLLMTSDVFTKLREARVALAILPTSSKIDDLLSAVDALLAMVPSKVS